VTELHPQIRAVLAAQAQAGADEELSLAEDRAQYDAAAPRLAGPPPPVARMEDRDAGGVPLRVYVPEGRAPFGVVLFLHGGGFVYGSLDSHDAWPATAPAVASRRCSPGGPATVAGRPSPCRR
jgi:acetyl esterase